MYNNLRRFLGLLSAVAVVYFGVKSEKILYWGIVPIFFGEILRLWAAGYIRKNKVLSLVGPYRYVRNPLYVGSFLIGVGFGIFTGNFVILALITVIFLSIYTLQINSEEKKLSEIFGEKYLCYKENVSRWVPRLKPYGDEREKFDIKLAIFKNKEYNSILGCLCLIIVILILRKVF
ncbi:MAG: isoprenylcysteine carboxylmethyltransferase family protein [Elusimicrobia bacterium]|nr:isoprenylcysteine carboxylmethyltransferase family protein [Elusimicrobiota bacterium]